MHPTTFQRFVTFVLKEFIGKGVEVYLDDILIHTEDATTHSKLLQEVIQTLKQNKLAIKLTKCEFYKPTVNFLGESVSENGIRKAPGKLASIATLQLPSTVEQVQRIIGIRNNCRRFSQRFADMRITLYALIKKNKPNMISWNNQTQKALDDLKLNCYRQECLNRWTVVSLTTWNATQVLGHTGRYSSKRVVNHYTP
jgi:Reverse transcriptase (RNA-dependent DNA polymerase)